MRMPSFVCVQMHDPTSMDGQRLAGGLLQRDSDVHFTMFEELSLRPAVPLAHYHLVYFRFAFGVANRFIAHGSCFRKVRGALFGGKPDDRRPQGEDKQKMVGLCGGMK